MSKRKGDDKHHEATPAKKHQHDQWSDLLRKTTLKDLCKHKPKLVVISDDAKLGDAMDTLSKKNILSLPVVNEEKKEFYGFLDVIDIAGFVLAVWKKVSVGLDTVHFPTQKLFNASVMDVLNFSNINSPAYLSEDATLEETIHLFTDPKSYFRLHRVAVQNSKGKVVNVISQSDIIHFASQHSDLLSKSLMEMKIGMMSGLIRTPIMIRLDSPFSEALEILYKNRISGLAMIDHEYLLAGNLSASDLRGMNTLGFDFFDGSVLQFLVKGTSSKPKRTKSVQEDETFGDVLSLLEKERIHRVYITSESGHPIGFISLIDVIARLPV